MPFTGTKYTAHASAYNIVCVECRGNWTIKCKIVDSIFVGSSGNSLSVLP